MKPILLLVHCLGIANFAYTIYFDMFLVNMPDTAPRYKFGGQWKFLTYINLWLQLFYFGISFIANVVSASSKRYKSLRQIRDLSFAAIIFPIGMFVSVAFWGLYFVDRALVFPKSLDKYIPIHVNHMQHSTLVPLLIMELLWVHHVFPRRWLSVMLALCFSAAYIIWTFVIAYTVDFWVYPILKKLDTTYRGLFIAACGLVVFLLYYLGETLNRLIWAPKRSQPSGKKKKTK